MISPMKEFLSTSSIHGLAQIGRLVLNNFYKGKYFFPFLTLGLKIMWAITSGWVLCLLVFFQHSIWPFFAHRQDFNKISILLFRRVHKNAKVDFFTKHIHLKYYMKWIILSISIFKLIKFVSISSLLLACGLFSQYH